MINFSRSLLSRSKSELAGNLLLKRDKGTAWLNCFSFRHGMATAGADLVTNGSSLGRTSASYTIFKGKAALSVSPKLPKFSKMDSGSSRINRNGAVFLTFWPAIGQRKYDWEKKKTFALSPTEVGSLISLGPSESCEFKHDPSMKSSLEGQVMKSLSITPIGNDGGYFLNLFVMNTIEKTNDRLSVPVTKAEFTVMRTALSFVLPHIIGWDQAIRPQPDNPSKQRREVQSDPDCEWGRGY